MCLTCGLVYRWHHPGVSKRLRKIPFDTYDIWRNKMATCSRGWQATTETPELIVGQLNSWHHEVWQHVVIGSSDNNITISFDSPVTERWSSCSKSLSCIAVTSVGKKRRQQKLKKYWSKQRFYNKLCPTTHGTFIQRYKCPTVRLSVFICPSIAPSDGTVAGPRLMLRLKSFVYYTMLTD